MTEILEGSYRIAQIYSDALSDIGLYAATNEQETGSRKSCCDQEHGQQETSPET